MSSAESASGAEASTAETTPTVSEVSEQAKKTSTESTETTKNNNNGNHTNVPLVIAYGTIVALWIVSQKVFLPYVFHLLALVTAIIYVGCHWSLILLEEDSSDDSGDEDNKSNKSSTSASIQGERLSKEDAYSFPLVGSVSLFSLYLAFKYLDASLVNLLIGGYFCIVGCLALTATTAPALVGIGSGVSKSLKEVLEKSHKFEYEYDHTLPASVAGESPLKIGWEFRNVDLLAIVPSAFVCYIYFQTKHWTLNNVLGICFCLQGIERFSLGTYKIGAILLVGLFFYDIFWVFGTDVMVTVAKNLDGPIKILFPRSLIPNEETGKLELSLLGLGDIVIPGFFLALLLRFDAHNASIPTSAPTNVHFPFPKPYFHSCLVGYVLGLATTLFVMIQFNAAQPALLYLVPACLASSLGCAYVRGEVQQLLDYSEEVEDEEEEEEEKEQGKEGKEEEKEKPEATSNDEKDETTNNIDAAKAKKEN